MYLIMNYGVRNKDLIVKIENDPTGNSLVRRKNDIIYTRRDYKTAGKYGTQTHRIKTARFIQEYEDLVKDRKSGYLFMNARGSPLTHNHIAQFITRQMNKVFEGSNLTQGKIFKIMNNEYKTSDAVKKHNKLMKTRGHQYSTNMNNY